MAKRGRPSGDLKGASCFYHRRVRREWVEVLDTVLADLREKETNDEALKKDFYKVARRFILAKRTAARAAKKPELKALYGELLRAFEAGNQLFVLKNFSEIQKKVFDFVENSGLKNSLLYAKLLKLKK